MHFPPVIPHAGSLAQSLQPPPEGDYPHVLQSWDTAVKSGELNDFSVCTTWMVWQGRYYLKDVFRKRLEYPELKRAVITLAERHRCRRLLIEDKASGSSLIQDLQGTTPCPVEAYQPPPGKDKWMRLFAQSDLFEMGKVMLPKAAPWLAEYRTELTSFPGSKYDDQVDSTTQALDHLRNNYGRNIEMWERLGR